MQAKSLKTERDREDIKQRIQQIKPGGGTAIYGGVQLGADQVRRFINREMVNRVILMSDGIANVGPSRTADLAELGKKLRKESMSVTTIGLGDDYNEDLMSALAEASAANYYYVKDAEKLPSIFAEEIGAVRSIVARSVTIQIKAPAGVKIKEILGHPEISCKDNAAQITLPEVFGSMKRRFLAKCEVTSESDEAKDVAAVDLQFEDTETGKPASQSQNAKVKFTQEVAQSDKSMRQEVVGNVLCWSNGESKKQAMELASAGKSKEAAEVLRSQIHYNSIVSKNLPATPAAVADDNQNLDAAAKDLETRGRLEEGAVKQFKADNFLERNGTRAGFSPGKN